jgi:hypothetical protein
MGDSGANPLYANMEAGDDVTTDIIGPSYSYADHISGPSSMGVGSDGNFGQLGRNAEAIAYYVEALITGNPPLGNQFYVNTGGTCVASDGQLRPRYNYVNNMNTGKGSLPAGLSEIASDFNGLIPGVVDDIEGLNPLHIFTALTADASPACKCYSCPVTSGGQYQFLTPELSADYDPSVCQEVDISNCPAPTESFTNQNETIFPTILAFLGILYIVFSE